MRDRGSHKTKRASYIEESWAIVYRNAVIRSYESRRGTRAPHICMAGLCYDRQPIEAMSFVVTIPDKTPYTMSYDFYQEKLPYKPLAERFRRKNRLL